MKISSTGFSGTIGKHLKNSSNLRIELAPFSIQGQEDQISSSDAVIHLAGIVGVSQVEHDLNRSYEVNVSGTAKFAEFVRDYSAAKFIFVSSSHVYKPSFEKIAEDSPLNPRSNYAIQKLQSEEQLYEIFSGHEKRLLICRVFSILGRTSNAQSLGGAIMRTSYDSQKTSIKYGDDVRDFLSPKQAAGIIFKLAQEREAHGIINVCSGDPLSVRQAVEKFTTKANLGDIQVESGNTDIPYLVGDNSKMLKQLDSNEILWELDD